MTTNRASAAIQAANDYLRILRILEHEAGRRLDNLYVRAFLSVAQAHPAGISDAARLRDLDIVKSQVSRATAALSERSWRRNESGDKLPGLRWIVGQVDARDARHKIWRLTEQGHRVYEKLRETV